MESQVCRLEVSDARRLKALEDENANLKKLLARRCSTTPCSRMSHQKNGDARREARDRRSYAARVRGEARPKREGQKNALALFLLEAPGLLPDGSGVEGMVHPAVQCPGSVACARNISVIANSD
jgi:hypothetical protein